MTLNDIKRELPCAEVRWRGKKWTARLSGRLNPFATVSPYRECGQRGLIKTILGPCFQFSWAAVERAVNAGAILICD